MFLISRSTLSSGTSLKNLYEEVFDILNNLNLVPFNLEKYKKSEAQDINVLNRNFSRSTFASCF